MSKTLKILYKYKSRDNVNDQFMNKRKSKGDKPGIWRGVWL